VRTRLKKASINWEGPIENRIFRFAQIYACACSLNGEDSATHLLSFKLMRHSSRWLEGR